MSKHLVIVESPTKAKTIKRFLSKDFVVEASMGHVRDLPESKLGVDTEGGFDPEYVIPEKKEATVKKLKAARKKVEDLWIATDEDREGEAIGWHLTQVLKENPEHVKRIAFHEITESAIKHAVENPRTIDMRLVSAQQARRVLDRLVGYTLSPFLWKKVYRGLSAGRVQSVAVRILVDRERAIRAFVPDEYWTLEAMLQTPAAQEFSAFLQKKDGKKFVPVKKEEMDGVLSDLKDKTFKVENVEEKEVQRLPHPPFTTSTLQQEAARKLGFSVKQTMVVAQQLYEGIDLDSHGMTGLITYMRTDSVHMSEKALTDTRQEIEKLYGREYVLAEPRQFKTKSKGAQEAHEAIRPTELSRTPDLLKGELDSQQMKLYTLIWNRTMATQMAAAQLKRVGADISAGPYTFRATGQTIVFDGYLRVYEEGRDEGDIEEEAGKILPPLTAGETLGLDRLVPEQHFTKPPPRYTEASLVKKLEEEGIGRPSTYAPTITTIIQRGYVMKEGRQLIPQDVAFTVTDLLRDHFPDIVDLHFTAKMEQSLDDIAEGGVSSEHFLGDFYKPFEALVKEKTQEIKKSDVMKERELGVDAKTGLPVIARLGRFGPYVQLGHFDPKEKDAQKKAKKKGVKAVKEKTTKLRSASLPRNLSIDTVTLEQALALLQFPKDLGLHQGSSIIVARGRFGPYIKCGELTVSLKDIDPTTVTFENAVLLLKEGQERKKRMMEPLKMLGKHPESGVDILIKDGRYGPYVTDGTTNASLGKKRTVEEMTLTDAIDMLKKKAAMPKRVWRRKPADQG